jgi:hypothetical protein
VQQCFGRRCVHFAQMIVHVTWCSNVSGDVVSILFGRGPATPCRPPGSRPPLPRLAGSGWVRRGRLWGRGGLAVGEGRRGGGAATGGRVRGPRQEGSPPVLGRGRPLRSSTARAGWPLAFSQRGPGRVKRSGKSERGSTRSSPPSPWAPTRRPTTSSSGGAAVATPGAAAGWGEAGSAMGRLRRG